MFSIHSMASKQIRGGSAEALVLDTQKQMTLEVPLVMLIP